MDYLNLNGKEVKILVVDDDADILNGIEAGLDLPGITTKVYTAPNGLKGIQQAKAVKPDIMIVDLQMPDINGFEVVEEIRKDSQLARVKVILLTASDTPKNLWESIDRQIDDFLGKPFDLRELEARLINLLMSK